MRSSFTMGFAAFIAAAQPAAFGAVLTFEDLSCGSCSFDVVPDPYAGLSFIGWYFGVDTVYLPTSGVTDLFTDFADPAAPDLFVDTNSNNKITSPTPFVFDGAWFSGYSGVKFELSLAGLLVYTTMRLPDAVGPDPFAPTFLGSGYAGLIDTVVVAGVQGYYAMDNFTFSVVTPAVPEPATFGLILLGLGALALGARLHQSRQVELRTGDGATREALPYCERTG